MSLLKELLAEHTDYDVLEEDKGNLREIPDAWMKVVAKKYDSIGGKGSQIKELVAGTKNVSKYRTTIIDSMKDDSLVAIFVKIEDEPFALLYKSKTYSSSKPEYSIIAVDGEASKITKRNSSMRTTSHRKNTYSNRYSAVKTRVTTTYEQEGMPMSTLLPRLQSSIAKALSTEEQKVGTDDIFKNASIDIYGITADMDRRAKRVERSANKPYNKSGSESMKSDLAAGDKKFLKAKASEVSKLLQDEIIETLSGLHDKISTLMDDAAEGKAGKINFNDEINGVSAKLKDLQRVADAVNHAVGKDGVPQLIERWRGLKKSYKLESLLNVIKAIKSSGSST